MDVPALLAKITGFALFAWTAYSLYRHVRAKYFSPRAAVPAGQPAPPPQSTSEKILNSLLLYVWHAFMVAFSIGMIVNN